MQGHREPFFLPTKKNPAPAGEEEGWMILAASHKDDAEEEKLLETYWTPSSGQGTPWAR